MEVLIKQRLQMFNKKPDSEDLRDWIGGWDKKSPEIKKTLKLLKEQYGAQKAVEIYTEMFFMDLIAKKQKRDKESQ